MHRRILLYIAGYDPRGGRHYYNLFRRESKKQAVVDEAIVEFSRRQSVAPHVLHWSVKWEKSGNRNQTDVYFLEWDDLIRKKWKKSPVEHLRDFYVYLKTYIINGRFLGYLSRVPHQVLGFLIPALYFVLVFLLSIYCVQQAYMISKYLLPNYLSLFIATSLLVLIMALSIYIAKRFAILWLMRVFLFSANYACENKDDYLEKRIDSWVGFIKTLSSVHEGETEFLIVSHSVGTILTIEILDRLINIDSFKQRQISVLTLGECIPLVSGKSCASSYREKMKRVAECERIFWVDYTSKIDGACFPQLNFFKDAGLENIDMERFHFLSPRFHKLFSKEAYRKLKRNKYLSHFLYLMATEKSGPYNFYGIVFDYRRLREHTINKS